MWNVGTRWNQIETSPAWASSNAGQSCLFGRGSCASPHSMSDLSIFAKAVATCYKGRIKYYELWNEPNDTHYYTGSMSNMVAMAQTIRDAIKSVDSSAVILSPCPTWSSSGSPYSWMSSFLSEAVVRTLTSQPTTPIPVRVLRSSSSTPSRACATR
jgi:hypothetical protein